MAFPWTALAVVASFGKAYTTYQAGMAQRKRIVEATTNLYLSQNLTLNGNDFLFTAGDFFTGKKRRKPMLGYDKEGQMTFSQSQPLFFTLLGVEFKVSVGQ